MSPFDNIDEARMCRDDSYFRGNVSAQLKHIHECMHTLKVDRDDFKAFKIQGLTIASIIPIVISVAIKMFWK